jgi:hypothetical protein
MEINQPLDTIEIQIYTNIPGDEKKPVVFTKNTLNYLPTTRGVPLNEYPYFTAEYILPKEALKRMTYDKKINTLFNRELFLSMFKGVKKIKNDNPEKTQKNTEKNIRIMLEVLFPTHYPVVNNHTDTYSEFIEGKTPFKFSVNWDGLFPSFFANRAKALIDGKTEEKETGDKKNGDFCYLNIGGKEYTVLKVAYLNDFINNPKYSEIRTEYINFSRWKTQKKEEVDVSILTKKKDIIIALDEMKEYYYPLDKRCELFNYFTQQYKFSGSNNGKSSNINVNIYNLLKNIIKVFDMDGENELKSFEEKTNEEDSIYYLNNLCELNIPKLNAEINGWMEELTQNIEGLTNSTTVSTLKGVTITVILNTIKEKNIELKKLIKDFNNSVSEPNYEKINECIKKIDDNIYLGFSTKDPTYPATRIKRLLIKIGQNIEKIYRPKTMEPKIIENLQKFKKDEKFTVKKYDLIKDANISFRNKERKKDNDNDQTNIKAYKTAVDEAFATKKGFLKSINNYFTNDSGDSVNFSGEFKTRFSSISKNLKDIGLIELVKSTYFSENTNINTQNVDESVKAYFNDHFKEYGNFIETIKKFIPPNRESNNTILADYIMDFIAGNPKGFVDFLDNVTNQTINGNDGIMKGMRLSFDQYNKYTGNIPKYEIQVRMDLMEGKLTKEIIADKSCGLKDDFLVNLYNKILYKNVNPNKYLLPSNLEMFYVPDNGNRTDESRAQPKPPTAEKMGGKKKTRRGHKLTRRIRRTRKRCVY